MFVTLMEAFNIKNKTSIRFNRMQEKNKKEFHQVPNKIAF